MVFYRGGGKSMHGGLIQAQVIDGMRASAALTPLCNWRPATPALRAVYCKLSHLLQLCPRWPEGWPPSSSSPASGSN
eukprot:1159357-Pelagomonas_calceolata.AAC.12